MLRITRSNASGPVERFTVEGRLTRDGLARFEEAWKELLAEGARLELELSGLQFADREGVALLQALRRRGVSLVGATGFIDALLAESS